MLIMEEKLKELIKHLERQPVVDKEIHRRVELQEQLNDREE